MWVLMASLPPIDWHLARGIARPLTGDVPVVSRPQAVAVVADLRLRAQRAGALALEASELDSRPADRVVVVDRAGWTTAMSRMVQQVLGRIDLPRRTGWPHRLAGLGYGLTIGGGLGLFSRYLLGQYDAFSDDPALYLVAPNILAQERSRHFVPRDFRLWVAAHEQTHALQTNAAPWTARYLLRRFEIVARDDLTAAGLARGLATGGPGAIGWLGGDTDQALEEITALMTLLEGHADLIADRLGTKEIPSVRQLRRAFARGDSGGLIARHLPVADKSAQYRDGLSFCRAVVRSVKVAGLNAAFAGPEFLPTGSELRTPASWVKRVHG
ncbi:MAG: zinc-dependent metalloprotease [Arachnia sp.]